MTRNIIIKLAITLIVASLSYSVFWFFKTGQIEKQIAKFVSDNNVYVSSGEIKVSGFPFSQRVNIKNFKFRIPNKALNKNQIIISEIKAKSSIFGNNFEVTIGESMLEDENGNLLKITFNKDPNISISMENNRTITLNYQDEGYSILDVNQNHLYSAQSTLIKITSKSQEEGKISIKVNSDIKQIDGFDIVDFYKNVFEQSIVKGIQTEKIKLGSSVIKNAIVTPEVIDEQPQVPQNIEENLAKPDASADVKSLNSEIEQNSQVPAVNTNVENVNIDTNSIAPTEPTPSTLPNINENQVAQESGNNPEIREEELVNNSVKESIKSDFTLDAEYILTPNNSEQSAEEDFDPMKIQDLPLQYSKSLKINSASFSNENYKINISGSLTSVQDDSMPFGEVSIQVEKLNELIKSFKEFLVKALADKGYKISEPTATEQLASAIEATAMTANDSEIKVEATPIEAKPEIKTPAEIAVSPSATPVIESSSAESSPAPIAPALEAVIVVREPVITDPYDNFLKKIFDNIEPIMNELALKNPNSNLMIAEFNLKREKNLEFLINDSSIREILGKF